ncbi:protein-L-isoaspartate(D-aspartate) O-methyltransferase [Pedobacter sp. P351]|uniref:protein-L-isoaspartate(D-aspartate) O-methyltransferase n=1 Tax=Pedobacter superstes TaxID=3133441 RepID=UPI0030AFE8BF
MKRFLPVLLVLWISGPALSQNYRDLRNNMVSEQIEARGITHRPTLEALRKVERHLFVPLQYRKYAYSDTPLPIGYDQTISQPFMVAYMTQVLDLRADDRVLEIGTGSGYQAAVLAEIVKEVYTIEIVKELGIQSRKLLSELYKNVEVIIGDGYKGLKAKAPFDAIIVTAAANEIPPPLIEQLKEGGKMVIPVGSPSMVQVLKLVEKKKGKISITYLTEVRFVPFTREKN